MYMSYILKLVRKCLVTGYVYVIKLVVVMLMDINVVTTVTYS